MIGIHDYSIEFNGKKLLSGCNAEFSDGKLTALIGRNGAGKSTLLRSIIGLETRFNGDITVDGMPVKSMTPNERARKMALVATRRERVPGLTCRQTVELGRAPYTSWRGTLSESDNRIVEDALRSVGMEDYMSRHIDTLSDGEYCFSMNRPHSLTNPDDTDYAAYLAGWHTSKINASCSPHMR